MSPPKLPHSVGGMKNIAFASCRRVLPDVKCIKAVSYNGT